MPCCIAQSAVIRNGMIVLMLQPLYVDISIAAKLSSQFQRVSFTTSCMRLQGAKTSGRIPREATLQLSLTLSTALSGESTTNELYRDAADAAAGALDLAGAAASTVTEQYQSAVRLQNMTGQVCSWHLCDFN